MRNPVVPEEVSAVASQLAEPRPSGDARLRKLRVVILRL